MLQTMSLGNKTGGGAVPFCRRLADERRLDCSERLGARGVRCVTTDRLHRRGGCAGCNDVGYGKRWADLVSRSGTDGSAKGGPLLPILAWPTSSQQPDQGFDKPTQVGQSFHQALAVFTVSE